ncbi:MAG TPA: PQQ-dependent sugar dehydrogenase [Candidatus Nanoarchaeia archaeon]|nr:PQQ-dependent sugar dehydrogenase [Candidatus Nanoarchaeia archaeon]
MKKKFIISVIIAVVILFIILLIVILQKPITKPEFDLDVLVENLDTPWAIDFLPDSRMIFTERNGKISLFDDGEITVIANLKVNEEGESGLLGIAVDPKFSENKFIYVYYTYENGNRVSRFILSDEKLEKEFILLDNIPNAQFHDGGRIKFGPDGKLYITTGDATYPSSAQDINSIAGKILRINKDGTIPEDNPFGNYIYSYGHRNPQGIAWHPITAELYSSEHGPSKNDELNVIVKGGNYGWPIVECDEMSDRYINPIRCYSEFTLAPSGITFYNNDLYIASLRGTQLRKIVFDKDNKTILSEEELFNNLGRIREVVKHEGYLYIVTSNYDGRGIPRIGDDKIIRIKIK